MVCLLQLLLHYRAEQCCSYSCGCIVYYTMQLPYALNNIMSISLSTAVVSFHIVLNAVTCPTLSDPANGMVVLTGMMATYSCNDGFILVGNGVLNCRPPGSWDKSPPTCQRGKFLRYSIMYNERVCTSIKYTSIHCTPVKSREQEVV